MPLLPNDTSLLTICLAACLLTIPSSANAQSACAKDEVLKFIDKGLSKADIGKLCSNFGEKSDEPAKPAPKDVSSILEAVLKDLADFRSKPKDDFFQLDKILRNHGLALKSSSGDSLSYSGNFDGLNISLDTSPTYLRIDVYEQSIIRDTAVKKRFERLLPVVQSFASRIGTTVQDSADRTNNSPAGYSETTRHPSDDTTCIQQWIGSREMGAESKKSNGRDLMKIGYKLGGILNCRERGRDLPPTEYGSNMSFFWSWQKS